MSPITGATYDEKSLTLTITFIQGATHQYPNVSPELAKDFLASPSKGSFFHANIKKLTPHV